MSISAEHNLYPGINPHLNSALQQPDGGWEMFHARHIADLAALLDTALPPQYYAVAEKSLQVRAYPQEADDIPNRPSRTTPDVTVYRARAGEAVLDAPQPSAPALIFPVAETFTDEETLTGVLIYRLVEGKMPGQPVTRLELLSPGNKPGGGHYAQYLAKRQQALLAGLCLVELDYLHETPPALRQIPSYADGEADAYPFTIAISDPRPNPSDGRTQVYGFPVSDPLPALQLPLADADRLMFDFGAAYAQTFAALKVFRMLVDYAQPPANFARYDDADRAWITARMRAIAAAAPPQ
jgi:hypothetical protein